MNSVLHSAASFVVLAFGFFCVFKNKKNAYFAVFCLAISIWLLASAFAYQSVQESQALFWFKISYIGIIFIPSAFYGFIFNLLGRKQNKTIILNYLISAAFIFLLYSSGLLVEGVYKYSWGYYPKVSFIIHFPFILFFNTLFAVSIVSVFLSLRSKTSELSLVYKNRLKYVFAGSLVGTLGAIDFVPNYGIDLYPFGFVFMVIFPIIFTYAILRHQLMDIEVLIKKSLVFAGMFTFVFGVVVAVAILIAQLLGGSNNLLAFAISALFITFTLRPIEAWLTNATDKFLFQKKHEYKEIIKSFIDNVITELNLDAVVSSTLKLLGETIHPYTSAVFILNKAEDKYQLYNAIGLEDKNITFASDAKLVTFLKKTRNPAVIRQIDGIRGVNPEIAVEMAGLEAVIALPLLLHDDLIGFISLGRKKSDEEYSKDDLDVLLDLARTESIAVANAQLLTEAAQNERRAAIGTMAAGINHEIGNPLNIINTKIQLFLAGVERGLCKNRSREEIIQECHAILSETINQTNRIAEITRRLSNFAKPSKEFKPESLNLSAEIEETLSMVGHDLELDKIQIEKNISVDLSGVMADRREIQQIFFNLIRNAAQAIEGEGKIILSAMNIANNKVRVEVRDTGKGIPEDKIHRIFEPFFTTKGPGKGTGLGLSIVRQLVWKNKGEISFKSQVNVGTSFILEFPKGGLSR